MLRGWAFVFLILAVVTGWLVFGVQQASTTYHVLFSLSVVSFIVVAVYMLARLAARDIERHFSDDQGAGHGDPGSADPVQRNHDAPP